MEEIMLTGDWQKPVSKEQIKALLSAKGAINFVSFEDFLEGRNPSYQFWAGKISEDQIKVLEAFNERIKRGEYSHVNFETTQRFLSKEEIFRGDYFSFKKFAEQNKNKFYVWENTKYELGYLFLFPVKNYYKRSLRIFLDLKKTIPWGVLIKKMGGEKGIFEVTPQIPHVIYSLKYQRKIFHQDGKWNYIPILNKDKEIIFLRVWFYNGIINLDISQDDPMEYEFLKNVRILTL